MLTRGEAKRFRPRWADGYALWDNLTDGQYTCRRQGKAPCSALLRTLRHCEIRGIADAAGYERDRMKRDARV